MKKNRRSTCFCLFLCLIMIFSISAPTLAADTLQLNDVIRQTANYLYQTVPAPQIGSIGGEWAVLGLARSDTPITPTYYESYYQAVERSVREHNGILHDKKYTEYSRVIVALTAIGKNPSDVAGYDLLMPLGDYESTVWQGINGAIWALIALDSGNYIIPQNTDAATQATREHYVRHILDRQTADGGWTISGDTADADVTAMALQALSNYQDNATVQSAVSRALVCLSDMQNETGGFATRGTETAESDAQVLVALCELGISPDDARFVKNGNSVLSHLLTYYQDGGFCHTQNDEINPMATEQAFYALVAAKRYAEGKNSLYHMRDAISLSDRLPTIGLAGKHSDVSPTALLSPGKTFQDITNDAARSAIESLAAHNIINGKTDTIFEPNSTMTRAEFAAITVRALALPDRSGADFEDVNETDWFYRFVHTASAYGIVNGISETSFAPNGTITREEAAVMVMRAAALCGMEPQTDPIQSRDILAAFGDYVTVSAWATDALAFCYRETILPDDAWEIHPQEAVNRAQIAQMLFTMLSRSNLI